MPFPNRRRGGQLYLMVNGPDIPIRYNCEISLTFIGIQYQKRLNGKQRIEVALEFIIMFYYIKVICDPVSGLLNVVYKIY